MTSKANDENYQPVIAVLKMVLLAHITACSALDEDIPTEGYSYLCNTVSAFVY